MLSPRLRQIIPQLFDRAALDGFLVDELHVLFGTALGVRLELAEHALRFDQGIVWTVQDRTSDAGHPASVGGEVRLIRAKAEEVVIDRAQVRATLDRHDFYQLDVIRRLP